MQDNKIGQGAGKAMWIEPELMDLEVSIADTAMIRTRGTDGNVHLDCTKS